MGLAPPHEGLERLAGVLEPHEPPQRLDVALQLRRQGLPQHEQAATVPGVVTTAAQPEGRDATTPARTKDVLPAPEGPITARSRRARMRCQSASTSPSRPKKRSASASVKEPRPGYGLVVPPSSPTSADATGRSRTASSAKARSCAEWKRSSGSFARQRRTTRSTGRGSGPEAVRTGGGSSCRIAEIVSAAVAPEKARRPDSAS